MRPLRVDGRLVEQVGMPYHFGSVGRVRGDSANDLLPFVADPNVSIMATKALTCDIMPGRRRHALPRPARSMGDGRDLPSAGDSLPEPARYKER